MTTMFIDRVHRLPRLWSNQELRKYAPLFRGDVVNVSGWKDIDKEGRTYRDYFTAAKSYTITNYKEEARGFQGFDGEIFLDLEADLSGEMNGRFDVVFNHTTLEHIYDFRKAFANLCWLSRDAVIIITPFLQQYHTDYGDYWRFSPLAIDRLFNDNGFSLVYQSFNTHPCSSVYVFSIATRDPERWRGHFQWAFSCTDPLASSAEPFIGCNAVSNVGHRVKRAFKRLFG